MTDDLTNNRPIFLFDEALIILEIGAASRESKSFLFTIGEQILIDEFPSIIGIQSQDRKRKEGAGGLQRRENLLSMLGAQGKAFGPSCSNIGEGECGEEASLGLSATMSH